MDNVLSTANKTYYNNVVCSMVYHNDSTSINVTYKNSCGYKLLNATTNGNYSTITGEILNCTSPWF